MSSWEVGDVFLVVLSVVEWCSSVVIHGFGYLCACVSDWVAGVVVFRCVDDLVSDLGVWIWARA